MALTKDEMDKLVKRAAELARELEFKKASGVLLSCNCNCHRRVG